MINLLQVVFILISTIVPDMYLLLLSAINHFMLTFSPPVTTILVTLLIEIPVAALLLYLFSPDGQFAQSASSPRSLLFFFPNSLIDDADAKDLINLTKGSTTRTGRKANGFLPFSLFWAFLFPMKHSVLAQNSTNSTAANSSNVTSDNTTRTRE